MSKNRVNYAFIDEGNESLINIEKIQSNCVDLYHKCLKLQERGKVNECLMYYHKLLSIEDIKLSKASKRNEPLQNNTFLYIKFLALKNIGVLYEENKKLEEAAHYYHQAFLIHQNDVSLSYKLGKILFGIKKYRIARTSLLRVYELNKSHFLGLDLLLDSCYRTGDFLTLQKICKNVVNSNGFNDKRHPCHEKAKKMLKLIKKDEFYHEKLAESEEEEGEEDDFDEDSVISVNSDIDWKGLLLIFVKKYHTKELVNEEKVFISVREREKRKVSREKRKKFEKINASDFFEENCAKKRKREDGETILIEDSNDVKRRKITRYWIVAYLRNTFLEDQSKYENEEIKDAVNISDGKEEEAMRQIIKQKIEEFEVLTNQKILEFIETHIDFDFLNLLQCGVQFLLKLFRKFRFGEDVKSLLRKISLILIENHFYTFSVDEEIILGEMFFDRYLDAPEKNYKKFVQCRKFLSHFEIDVLCADEEERRKVMPSNAEYSIRRTWLLGLTKESSTPEDALQYYVQCKKLFEEDGKENEIFMVNLKSNPLINIEIINKKITELGISSNFNKINVCIKNSNYVGAISMILGMYEKKISSSIREKLRSLLTNALFQCKEFGDPIFKGDNCYVILYRIFSDLVIKESDSITTIQAFFRRTYEFMEKVCSEPDKICKKRKENVKYRKYLLGKLYTIIDFLQKHKNKTPEIPKAIAYCFMNIYIIGTVRFDLEKFIHLRNIRCFLTLHFDVTMHKEVFFFRFLLTELDRIYRFFLPIANNKKDVIPPSNNINLIEMEKEIHTVIQLATGIKVYNMKLPIMKEVLKMSVPGEDVPFAKNPKIARVTYTMLEPFAREVLLKKRMRGVRKQVRLMLEKIYKAFNKFPRELHEIRDKIKGIEDGDVLLVSSADVILPIVDLEKLVGKDIMPIFETLFSVYSQYTFRRAREESKADLKLFENDDYIFAMFLLRKSLACSPEDEMSWIKLGKSYTKLAEELLNVHLEVKYAKKKILLQEKSRKYLSLGFENVSNPKDYVKLVERSVMCHKIGVQLLQSNHLRLKVKQKRRIVYCRFEIVKSLFRIYKFQRKFNTESERSTKIATAILENLNLVKEKKWNDYYLLARIKEYEKKYEPIEILDLYSQAFYACEGEGSVFNTQEVLPFLSDCLYRFYSFLLKCLELSSNDKILEWYKNNFIKLSVKLVAPTSSSYYYKLRKILKSVLELDRQKGYKNVNVLVQIYDNFLKSLKIYNYNFRAVFKITKIVSKFPYKNPKLALRMISIFFRTKNLNSEKPKYYKFNIFIDPSIPVNRDYVILKWQFKVFNYMLNLLGRVWEMEKDKGESVEFVVERLSFLCATFRKNFLKVYVGAADLYKRTIELYLDVLENKFEEKKYLKFVLEVFVYVMDGFLKNQFSLISRAKVLKEKTVKKFDIRGLRKESMKMNKKVVNYCKKHFKVDYTKSKKIEPARIQKRKASLVQGKLGFKPESKKKKKKPPKKKKASKKKKKKNEKTKNTIDFIINRLRIPAKQPPPPQPTGNQNQQQGFFRMSQFKNSSEFYPHVNQQANAQKRGGGQLDFNRYPPSPGKNAQRRVNFQPVVQNFAPVNNPPVVKPPNFKFPSLQQPVNTPPRNFPPVNLPDLRDTSTPLPRPVVRNQNFSPINFPNGGSVNNQNNFLPFSGQNNSPGQFFSPTGYFGYQNPNFYPFVKKKEE